jgi:hypothetical protein
MKPPSYMGSVVDRNVVMRRLPVYVFRMDLRTKGDFCSIHQLVGYFTKEVGCSLCGTEWMSCEQIRLYFRYLDDLSALMRVDFVAGPSGRTV